MKITHVFHHFSPCTGGIETVIERMCEQSLKLGDRAGVVCLNKCPNSSRKLPAVERVHGIRVERIPFLNLHYYKFAPSVLWKLGEADIVHVHGLGFFSDFLALKKLVHGKKLVLSTHGGIFHSGKGGFLKKVYFFLWARLVLRLFDRVVAVSRQDLELFGKVVPKKKLVLIENGVGLEKFSKLGGNKNKGSFLFVGRLSKNKRVEMLLEAFAVAAAADKKARLTIAGQDFRNLREGLEKRAKWLGIGNRVSFKGEVSEKELLRLYAESEFFVSASSYEGFGITALEAMASGLIPVLNRIPSFEGFVGKGRGIIADFSDAKKAGAKMLKALELSGSEKKRMVEKGKEFCKGFSWEKKGKEFQNLYSRFLGQGRTKGV